MKTKYLICFNFLTFLIIISCETSLEFELPKIDPVPAILSSNDPDCKFIFRVTNAKPFQDSIYQINPECRVKLFEEGNFFTELSLDTSSFESILDEFQDYPKRIFIKDPELKFSENKEYKVEVSIPGYSLVSAKTYIPAPIEIKSVTWKEFDGVMPHWYEECIVEALGGYSIVKYTTPLIEWTITFDDPPAINNYYRIGLNYRYLFHMQNINSIVDGKLQYAPSNSNDPVFMYVIYVSPNPYPRFDGFRSPDQLAKEIIFNDYNFDGKEYSVKILTPRPREIQRSTYLGFNSDFKYIINLYSLSEDYYKYWLDRYKFEKLSKDPFAEPIRIHSNISNGAGIFAFSSLDTDTVPMNINY